MDFINKLKNLKLSMPLVLGSVILFSTVLFSTGYDFADEHFQILEIANYKIGNTPASTLAWEFHAQMRPSLQPTIAYTVIKTCNFFSIYSPFIIATVLRLISAILILLTISLLVKAFKEYYSTQLSKNYLYTMFLFTWFLPFNFVRFSSENWSGMAFMLALALYLLNREKKNNFNLLFVGFLTGLSFVFRYQSVFMIFGLGLWMIIIGKESFKKIILFGIGNIAAIVIGILLDRWLYGNWVLTFWNYLDFNIIQDKVSEFGILPWWFYFENIFLKATPPIGICIIISFIYIWVKYPKNILTWISVPFILIHILIGHKELRFLYPLLLLTPIVFAIFITNTQTNNKLKLILQNNILKKIAYFIIGINIAILLIMCFKPADESISFYKRIYIKYKNQNTELIIIGNENPYIRGGKNLPISFYKPKMLLITNIQSDALLTDSLLFKKNRNYLFAIKKFDARNSYIYNNLKFTKIYQTYPEWVEQFNVNNWMSRTKVWTIYEIKKMNDEMHSH